MEYVKLRVVEQRLYHIMIMNNVNNMTNNWIV